MDPKFNCFSKPSFLNSLAGKLPDSFLVTQRGGENKSTASYSHYLEPISPDNPTLHGYSRRWGDASPELQRTVIHELLNQAFTIGFTPKQTAFLLATTRVESGFNPDAAAQSTSASGLGQFIDATGDALGLTDQTRFSIGENASAFVTHLSAMIGFGTKKYETDSTSALTHAYALYHDGPNLNYGGLEVAKEKVMPWTERFFNWFQEVSAAGCEDIQFQNMTTISD